VIAEHLDELTVVTTISQACHLLSAARTQETRTDRHRTNRFWSWDMTKLQGLDAWRLLRAARDHRHLLP